MNDEHYIIGYNDGYKDGYSKAVKDLNLPVKINHQFFADKQFSEIWDEFIKLKKRKKASTTEKILSKQLKNLEILSNNNVNLAIEIVEKSVVSGWSDLYELKNQNNGTSKSQSARNSNSIDKRTSIDNLEKLAYAVLQGNSNQEI